MVSYIFSSHDNLVHILGNPSSSMGCCSWRQTCCGGGCCEPIPSKCHSAEQQENVRRSQTAMADPTYVYTPSETTINGTTMASALGRNGTTGNIDFFFLRELDYVDDENLQDGIDWYLIIRCYLIRDEGRHIIGNNIEAYHGSVIFDRQRKYCIRTCRKQRYATAENATVELRAKIRGQGTRRDTKRRETVWFLLRLYDTRIDKNKKFIWYI